MKLKKGLRIFVILILILIAIIILSFVIWFFTPSKNLYIAVLDKTVPATAADGHSYLDDVDNIFRKHMGLNWILDYKKVKNPLTNSSYDYKKDYYGYQIDTNYEVTRELFVEDIKEIPDLLYLSDTYGTEITEDKGISDEDMNTIALCHSMGSVVIGEQDIMNTGTDENISLQLQNMFGIEQTGWVGRYIYDLADLTDVPYWAPPMYKEKYGVEWRCSGSGILLVSGEGDIIVLEGKTDFEDDNLLKISTTDDFSSEFGKRQVNYYSWFELIEANSNTQTIAEYEFNLNSTGMEEFAPVSDNPVFSAVVRNKFDGAPTYYFAGDFNDYVDDMNISCFLGADLLYRTLSFDRDGDVTHFYWEFFEPMVKAIINEVSDDPRVEHTFKDGKIQKDKKNIKLKGDNLQVYIKGKWKNLTVKGFNLHAEMPGNDKYEYTRDFTVYKQLIDEIDSMGGNAVRAYDLYPPEFYRALYEHNVKEGAKTIYLYQGIITPDNIDRSKITENNSIKQMYKNIEHTVDAMHGNANVADTGSRAGAKYRHNVSKFLATYFVDADMSVSQLKNLIKNSNYSYSGKYLRGTDNPAESLYASLCDHLLQYQNKKYFDLAVVAAKGETSMLEKALWQDNNSVTFNLSNIFVNNSAKNYFAAAYSAKYSDSIYQDNKKVFRSKNKNAYDGYLKEIKKNSTVPVFIDDFGASACANVFDRESDVYGLTEEEQSNQILSMYKSINNGGFAGGLISDLNDSWSSVSDDNYPITVPYSSKGLWHDVTDLKQTSGVIAVESKQPEEIGLELAQTNQRMSNMQLSSNETYLYLTVSLDTEVDFDKEELFLGFDTYQRNNGEYYYDKAFFGNALSGMEFVIKFDSKNSASLYCVPSYNRSKGRTSSKESYNANYDLMCVLSYGSFSSQNTQFFTTGNTIRVRLPWAVLNITDPSQRIVINDTSSKPGGINNQYKTTITNGLICSVFIGDKKSEDTMYIFPSDKKSPGYKVYKWTEWKKENVDFTMTQKAAADALKAYFSSY